MIHSNLVPPYTLMFGIQFVGDKFEILVTEMTVQVSNILNVTNIIVAHSPNSIPFHILNQRPPNPVFHHFFSSNIWRKPQQRFSILSLLPLNQILKSTQHTPNQPSNPKRNVSRIETWVWALIKSG